MVIFWRSSAESFTEILGRHGLAPDSVTDVEAAWRAFSEFLQVEVDGLVGSHEDPDGFIVQWGRYSWNDDKPALTFTRQLTVPAPEDDDPDYQELWQIELELRFDAEPGVLDQLDSADSGFDFTPTGPRRAAALALIHTELQRHPQLRIMWQLNPVTSQLEFEHVC